MTMNRVGCAGIIVRDIFCGPVRLLPRPGELVSIDSLRTRAGGCAANVAIDLRKQGVDVDIAGCLGCDTAGETLVQTLQATGINCDRLAYTRKYPTSETIILLVEGEDRRYLHSFGANREFSVRHIDREWLAKLDLFYLGGLCAMPNIEIADLIDLLAFCRDQNVTSVVDVVVPCNFRGAAEIKELLPYTDWFLPNDTEAAALTGQTDPLEAIHVFQTWQSNGVVVTLGERGAVAARGNEYWRCGAYTWESVDPSGAGDAFASGFIAGLLESWDLPRTLTYASALGGSATRAIGTTDGVFNRKEAHRLVAEHPIAVTRENIPHRAEQA